MGLSPFYSPAGVRRAGDEGLGKCDHGGRALTPALSRLRERFQCAARTGLFPGTLVRYEGSEPARSVAAYPLARASCPWERLALTAALGLFGELCIPLGRFVPLEVRRARRRRGSRKEDTR